MAQDNLKQKTKKGLYWSAASNFANQGMRFVFGLILARLLSPDAYGVIGMLTVFLCVVQVFIDCGFSQALIAKQDRTQTDFSTEIYFNIGVGLIGYCLLFISAPFIADFYNMPLLTSVLRVVGLGVIINSLCVVQSAQFAIRLDFKTPAKLAVITNMFSGVVGIFLAYCGYGVWALVFQQIAGNFLNGILLWILAGWRPSLEFSKDSFKYLWSYGSKILASSLIQQVYDNLYPLVIGKFFSARQLGLYSRAQGFASLPSTNLSGVLGSVTFPVLSKIQNDREQLIQKYRKMIKVTCFIAFPIFMILCGLSHPLVVTLITAKWKACVIFLQIMCFAKMWWPFQSINRNLIIVIGRSDLYLKLEIYKKIIFLSIICISLRYGLVAFCISDIIVNIIGIIFNTYYTDKLFDYGLLKQLRDVFPSLLLSLCVLLIAFAITAIVENDLLQLLLGGISGGCFYIGAAYLLKFSELKEVKYLLNRK